MERNFIVVHDVKDDAKRIVMIDKIVTVGAKDAREKTPAYITISREISYEIKETVSEVIDMLSRCNGIFPTPEISMPVIEKKGFPYENSRNTSK